MFNFKNLSQDIENLILDYKYQIEHVEKFKYCLEEITNITYSIDSHDISYRDCIKYQNVFENVRKMYSEPENVNTLHCYSPERHISIYEYIDKPIIESSDYIFFDEDDEIFETDRCLNWYNDVSGECYCPHCN